MAWKPESNSGAMARTSRRGEGRAELKPGVGRIGRLVLTPAFGVSIADAFEFERRQRT